MYKTKGIIYEKGSLSDFSMKLTDLSFESCSWLFCDLLEKTDQIYKMATSYSTETLFFHPDTKRTRLSNRKTTNIIL